jgi:hypothetical protein
VSGAKLAVRQGFEFSETRSKLVMARNFWL